MYTATLLITEVYVSVCYAIMYVNSGLRYVSGDWVIMEHGQFIKMMQ